jgi:hypothetical protein
MAIIIATTTIIISVAIAAASNREVQHRQALTTRARARPGLSLNYALA